MKNNKINIILTKIWYIVVLGLLVYLVYNNYGGNQYININTLTRNDILFIVLIFIGLLPLLKGIKITTPFGSLESSAEKVMKEKDKLAKEEGNNVEQQMQQMQQVQQISINISGKEQTAQEAKENISRANQMIMDVLTINDKGGK